MAGPNLPRDVLAEGSHIVQAVKVALQDAAGDDLALVVDQFVAAQGHVATGADERGRAFNHLRFVLGLGDVVLGPGPDLRAGFLVAVTSGAAPFLPTVFVGAVLVRVTLGLDVEVLCGTAHLGQFGAEMQVAIEQAGTVDGQPAQRLDGGAVVEDEAGASRGLIVGIERAADVHGVTAATGAENQRLLAIVDEAGADIQTLARGNDGSATAFLAIVEGAGPDGEVVAIDPPGADIVQGTGVDAGLAAVDEATVGQGVACDDGGASTAHFTGNGVVDVSAAHFKVTRLEQAVVRQ